MNEISWRQDELTMYGKKVTIPRLHAWYGDSATQTQYGYSGLMLEPLPWIPTLLKIKHDVEYKLGMHFNSVLVNLYRDGNDTVGWHSDDEIELGINPTIASLSLGQTRNFSLKHKLLNKKLSLELKTGSLLVMSGETQACWQHSLPRTKQAKLPRINLTFRQII